MSGAIEPTVGDRCVIVCNKFCILLNPGGSPSSVVITVTSPVAISGTVGTAMSIDLTNYAYSTPAHTLNFALASGNLLPSGLSLSSSIISGTPQTSGYADVGIVVSYGNISENIVLNFTISSAPSAPTITVLVASTTVNGTTGSAITPLDVTSGFVTVSDGGTPTFSSSDLPSGISISSGVISGTPVSSGQTSSTINVSYTNAYGTATASFTVVFDVAASGTTYYYTVSGSVEYPGANGDYELYSGTHGQSDAIYTNGTYYIFYAGEVWVIHNNYYWDVEGGPIFFSMLRSDYISSPTSPPTGTWENGMNMPSDEAVISTYSS